MAGDKITGNVGGNLSIETKQEKIPTKKRTPQPEYL